MFDSFRRVVVPVDLTDRNVVAVAMAGRLVEVGAGTIHLLHVIETIEGLGPEEERSFFERLERTARKHLEKLGAPLEALGHSWRADVVRGSRAKRILEESLRLDADLIVTRSHRLGEEAATAESDGYGTLSYQIGFFAPCSVLLVK